MGFAFKVLLAFFPSVSFFPFMLLNNLQIQKEALSGISGLCGLKKSDCTEGSVLIALREDGVYVHTVESDHCTKSHSSSGQAY